MEQRVEQRTAALGAANKELEAFSYSVSHDLRAPLRAIDGFSLALIEDYGGTIDAGGQDSLRRVRAAAVRMGELIDALLQLSRLSRAPLERVNVDLTALAQAMAQELRDADPDRPAEFVIAPHMTANADLRLIRVVLDNLMRNAWKFTRGREPARIEVGVLPEGAGQAYFVRDNGAGFDMKYVDKLFGAFQRLHRREEFEGTGIGLATVQRIIHRHGGRAWAEGVVGQGAAFYFTL